MVHPASDVTSRSHARIILNPTMKSEVQVIGYIYVNVNITFHT